tara:strand:+ start:3636 stop:4016 length:381 start_codon:yes stop_codon:yes gene_type:complete
MVDREVGNRESFTAVLTSIPVTREEIATIETNAVIGLTVAGGDPDDPRRRHIPAGRPDPIMVSTLVLTLKIGDLQPGRDVEGFISPAIDRDDLGDLAEQEDEGLTNGNDPYGRVAPVENQNRFIEC